MGKKSLIIFIGLIAVVLSVLFFFFLQKNAQIPIAKKDNKIAQPRLIPGSCKILPEEFCSRGERVVSVSNGKNYTYVGFHLPPGTPLFSLIDGLLLKAVEGGNPYSGFLAQVRDDTQSHGYAFRGDIAFDNMLQRNVKAGDKIANIGNSGVTNLGGYNFIFTINTPGPVTDEEMMRTLFRMK